MMRRYKQRQPTGPGFVAVIAILALFATCPQHHFQADQPVSGPPLVSAATQRIQLHEDLSFAMAVVPLDNALATVTFNYAFVKFDRKQNTRLWPFVTTGTTRSPPLFV